MDPETGDLYGSERICPLFGGLRKNTFHACISYISSFMRHARIRSNNAGKNVKLKVLLKSKETMQVSFE